MEFDNKIVLITGGAKGIGNSICRAFSREGAICVIADKDPIEGLKIVSEIKRANREAHFIEADVSAEDNVTKIRDFISNNFSGLDILVNNAGIGHDGTVVEDDPEVWDEVISVNLKSVYLCSHFLIPQIYRRGGGVIINVGSTQSLVAKQRSAAYISSKFGVMGLTKAMAVDHAPLIRVNIVLPGSVDTPMFRDGVMRSGEPDKLAEYWSNKSLMNRIANPDEIASVVLFLAGDKSSFITGTSILVDGGALAKL